MSWCLQVPVKEYRTPAVRPPRSLPRNVQSRRLCGSPHKEYGLESAQPDLQSTFKKPGGDPPSPLAMGNGPPWESGEKAQAEGAGPTTGSERRSRHCGRVGTENWSARRSPQGAENPTSARTANGRRPAEWVEKQVVNG